MEEWKTIEGYEGRYEVSAYGRVRSLQLNNKQCSKTRDIPLIMKQHVSSKGYRQVTLCINGEKVMKLVHRLVLLAFRGPSPAGWAGCHLNGNLSDNCIDNLQWGSYAENESHKIRHGTVRRGEQNHIAKLTEPQVREIRSLNGLYSHRRIAKLFGVSRSLVWQILTGKIWSHVTANDAMIFLLLFLLSVPSAWADEWSEGKVIEGSDSLGNVVCPGFSKDPIAHARIQEYCKHRFDADAVCWADRIYPDEGKKIGGYAICAEKMEAAMKAMEEYISFGTVNRNKPRLQDMDEFHAAYKLWESTKRECFRKP